MTNYKLIIPIMGLAIVLCSCGSGGSSSVKGTDTTGLAAFQQQQAVIKADSIKMATEQKANSSNSLPNSSSPTYLKSNNSSAATSSDNGASANSDASANTSTASNTSSEEAPVQKKKGMSHAAKDALIGAGSGAILGAVVTKHNRGLGAVVGAAVGGGVGYGVGKHKDNKDAGN